MKNISKLFLALFALVMFSCSVEDVQDRPVIEASDAPVITAPTTGSSYVITPATSDKLLDRFAWTPANFNADVVVTYQVEIAKLTDKEFTKPQLVQSSKTNNVAVTGDNLNKAAIDLGLTPFVPTTVLARVKAVVGTQVIGSKPIEIAVNPFKTAPLLGLVGNHQGWNPAGLTSAYQMKPSAKGNSDFEGYAYLDGGFKFLEADDNLKFDWANVAYGSGGAGVLDTKGGDITAAAGYYYVKADTQKLTYSLLKQDWGIIGDATPGGWGTSTPMTFDKATNTWKITATLTANELKFRPNNDWPGNFGDNGGDNVLEGDGANIKIPSAGTYEITLDLSKSRAYTYTLVKK